MKKLLKKTVYSAAALMGRHRLPWGGHSLLVLMYHRVLPEANYRRFDEQPGMVISPTTLDQQLELISRHFTVVRLADWLRDRREGRLLPKRACAITFDDGWRDNYQHAFPLLRRHGLPATIYLVADLIGTGQRFWPNRIIRLLDYLGENQNGNFKSPEFAWLRPFLTGLDGMGTITTEFKDTVIGRLKARSDMEITSRLQETETMLGWASPGLVSEETERVMLNWDEIGEMSTSGLVDFGSHTCRHVRMLPGLDDELRRHEIIHSREIIEKQLGKPVETFCYPNGNMTPEADIDVRAHYCGAITTRRGWNSVDQDPYYLHRIGIHEGCGYPLKRFEAQISGWF